MRVNEVLLTPENDYYEFLRWADKVEESTRVDEGLLDLVPGPLKKIIDFIKQLAVGMKVKFKELVAFFKNAKIFKFFKDIHFSMTYLYGLLKKGFQTYQQFLSAIADFVAKTPAGQWTKDKLHSLDEFLQNHPKTKRVAGVLVAAMLAYIWFNMTFTGDPSFDFGMDDLLAAIAGKFKLSTLFAGPEGTKLLLLFATGAIGLSFPWPGPSKIQFAIGIVQTLARKVKAKFTPDPNPLGD